jgi:pantetheine-phosphate adenylyltransferase
MRALYPGSFDPLTLGHLDLIERAARLFDGVIVAVLQNPGKTPAFSLDQRLQQIHRATHHLQGVEVGSFDGLTVEYARSSGAGNPVPGHGGAAQLSEQLGGEGSGPFRG